MGFTGAGIGSPFGPAIPTSAVVPKRETKLSRWIDPKTGLYSVDEDTGLYKTMPSARQRVMLALLTVRGSSSVLPDLGTERPKKLGGSWPEEQRAEVRRALRQLSDVEKTIRIDRIDVSIDGPGRGTTTVVYTDIESGVEDEVSVG